MTPSMNEKLFMSRIGGVEQEVSKVAGFRCSRDLMR